MGMDVSGLKPSSKEGEYFRANVWSWRPIQALCMSAGCQEAEQWGTNDGLGLRTQEECNRLANQIEDYIRQHPNTEFVIPLAPDSPLQPGVDEQGHFGKGNLSPYRTSLTHVRKFITFLRSCGGFEIW